jgi:putative toxin-antitoxin system antitoxin component (TIGR02293 family)
MSKRNDVSGLRKAPLSPKREIAIEARKSNKASGSLKKPTVLNINGSHRSSAYVTTSVLLSDATKKPESQMTALEKMDVVREGVSKRDLEHLKEKAQLDYDKLARALSVTRATLINKQKDQKFGSVVSEKIVSLADIYSYGYEVFEDEDKFNHWMFKSNRALGGKAPYDLVDNQFGREEVRNLIGRIDYGVYS